VEAGLSGWEFGDECGFVVLSGDFEVRWEIGEDCSLYCRIEAWVPIAIEERVVIGKKI
jgi:hypothetical protein